MSTLGERISTRVEEAIVIGAGPAGLASSRELSRAGVHHVVLERGDRPGLTEFTSAGVRFVNGSEEDFDHVILATGYRAAVGMLGNLSKHRS